MRRYWHDWTDQPRSTAARGVFGEGRTMAEVMAAEDEQRRKWREQYNAERKKP